MAVLYSTDGSSRAVAPKNGTDFQLRELYELLDVTTIECVYALTIKGHVMIIDEEGKLNGKLPNAGATRLITFNDVIVGNALVCRLSEVQ